MDRLEVTHADLIAAIQAAEASTGDGGGLTLEELCEATGWKAERMRIYMRRLVREGKCTSVRAQRLNMAGYLSWVPTYRVVP